MNRMLCLVISLFAWSAPVWAGTNNPFRVEAANTKLEAGAEGVIQVTVHVPAEHHLYRDMMRVSVVSAEGVKTGEASFPPGHSKPDPADPTATREQYDMDVVIEVPVTAPASAGEYPLTFEVGYQGCKKSLCWMPQTENVEATLRVAGVKK
jgi:thiol:disulfide interchange protein